MGGQKRRLRQRVKEVGEQVEESIRQAGEEQKLQHVAADQLFQVDSKGGDAPRLSKRQKLQIKDPLVKSRKFDAAKASRFEVERLKKLKAAQEAAAAVKPAKTQRKAESKQPALPWGQEEQPDADDYVAPALTAHQPAKRRKKVAASTRHRVAKVEVPAAGQSYHPDFEAHQDVMASAVAEELERRELRAKMAEPVRAGLSEETLQFINDKDSEDESEDESDEDDGTKPAKKAKLPEQVTRSQRNKRARHKQMELEHQTRRKEKAIIKQINTVHHIAREVERDEKESEKKQELKKLREEQKLSEEPLVRVAGKLTKLERETPVLFSEELTGNMRTLRPKGHPLLDRFDSLHKRNMIEIGGPRKTRKRKVRIIEVKK